MRIRVFDVSALFRGNVYGRVLKMASGLRAECPTCGKPLRVEATSVGHRVRCPDCSTDFVVSSVSFAGGASLVPSHVAEPQIADDAANAFAGLQGLSRLGRFELRTELGQGGFGRVYRAFDPVLRREVAIKVPQFLDLDADHRERFLNEARTAANLRHPNIVSVYECGESGGRLYIVSEYVKGETVAARLVRDAPAVELAVEWVREIAQGLEYAHAEGIVHRDIKPENLIVGKNGRPQILDFGLAKLTDEASSLTVDGSVMGTPAYMSPEQARGETKQVGPASDQYCLGATLYHLLTGQRPFDGPPHQVIGLVASTAPPAPRKIRPELPRDLEAICRKAMAPVAVDRYFSCAEFAADLDRWQRQEPVRARPMSLPKRLWRWCRREPRTAALLMGLAVVFLTGFTASLTFWGMAEAARQTSDGALSQALNSGKKEREALQLASARAEELLKQNEEILRANQQAREATLKAEASARDARSAARLARQQETAAKTAEAEARRQLYVTTMRLAQEAWNLGHRDQLIELLNRVRPLIGHPDLREWEWYYLHGLATGEVQSVQHQAGAGYGSGLDVNDKGTFAAGLQADHSIDLIRLSDGQLERSLPMVALPGNGGGEPWLTWQPGGNWLAAVTNKLPLVLIRHQQTGGEVSRLQMPDYTTAADYGAQLENFKNVPQGGRLHPSQWRPVISWLGWSPDGTSLAAALNPHRDSGSEQVWFLRTWSGNSLDRVRTVDCSKEKYRLFAWYPKGEALLAWDGISLTRIGIVDRQSTKLSYQSSRAITALAVHPEGKIAAIGDQRGVVRTVNLEKGTEIGLASVHRLEVTALAWKPDGHWLASCGKDRRVVVSETGTLFGNHWLSTTVGLHQGEPNGLRWGETGRLSSLGSNRVQVWETEPSNTGAALYLGGAMDVALSPDGSQVAVVGYRRPNFGVWDIRSGKLLTELKPKEGVWFDRIWWLPTGRQLLMRSTQDPPSAEYRGTAPLYWQADLDGQDIRALDWRVNVKAVVQQGELLHVMTRPPFSADEGIQSDGSIVPPPRGRELFRWSPEITELIPQASFPESSAWKYDFSRDRRRGVFLGGSDGIMLYDFVENRSLPAPALGPKQGASDVAISPNGDRVALFNIAINTVRLWDLDSRQLLHEFRGHAGGTTAVVWNSTGTRLATTGKDGLVRLWDVESGAEVLSMEGNQQGMTRLIWSPDDHQLLAFGSYGSAVIKLWDDRIGRANAERVLLSKDVEPLP